MRTASTPAKHRENNGGNGRGRKEESLAWKRRKGMFGLEKK
jgi:hypothetical protein